MRILVACEASGIVRDAFIAQGHDAVSCDLKPSKRPGPHIQDNVLHYLDCGWDMMIAHPECKYLCLSGARWFDDPKYPERYQQFYDAVEFFLALKNAPIDKICLENSQPLGRTLKRVGRYDQCVQPWMFGDAHTKGAYLWLKNLNPLIPTHTMLDYNEIKPPCHWESPGEQRSEIRAQTYPGLAEAMALQWGNGVIPEYRSGLFAQQEA